MSDEIKKPQPIASLRLAQLLVGEPWGGAERFFVKLAIALQKRGVSQKICILRNEERAEELRGAGCDVVQFDFGKGLKDWLERRRLQREINKYQPDVFMAWMNRAVRRMPKGDFSKVARMGGYYSLRYYQRCDWLIGNTPDLKDYFIREGWSPERSIMISNFGELRPMSPVSRAELDTPEDAVVMLALGRLHPDKGFDILLNALAKAPNVWLWLAGTGPQEEELHQQAAALGLQDRVRFLGWRNDQAALLQAADVCVVSSRHEPLSNVVIEAWSLGVPVLATASEGPGWLVDDHKTGLLTPLNEVEPLANAMIELRDHPELRAQLAQAGQDYWRAEFTEDVICQRYMDFFEMARRQC